MGRNLRRSITTLAVGAVATGGALMTTATPAAAATFEFTGSEQTFSVPESICSVSVTAEGAQGGAGTGGETAAGGLGAVRHC